MLAQALHVAHLQPRSLEVGDHRSDLLQLSVGEDEAVADGVVPGVSRPGGDAVVEDAAAGSQRVAETHGVLAHPGTADVLEHADAGDGVEGSAQIVSVVRHAHADAICHGSFRRSPACDLGLLGA